MANIKFSFLYRDAGNYKTYGEIVFANPDGLHPDVIKSLLLLACNPDGCFDPRLWGLPNIRTQPYDPELDHDWYEFEMVAYTSEPNSEERTMAEFLKVIAANPLRSPF